MNWELFSEKLSKNGRTVMIFYDREDVGDLFLTRKKKYYTDKGMSVITRFAKAKKSE